ncbi:hypothetical protein [Streptomyces sp. NPDC058084]|uniref:hypothetical protein n=1 Tax=Streptomyces sp. NPDC058084 TaxID=3346333 RepID=UPI0036EAB731
MGFMRKALVGAAGLALAVGVAGPASATEWEGYIYKNVAGCHANLHVKDFDSSQTYQARGEFLADDTVPQGSTCHFWLERRTTSGGYVYNQISGTHHLKLHDNWSYTYFYYDGPGYRVRACVQRTNQYGQETAFGCGNEY